MSSVNHVKIYSVVSKGCIFFDGTTVQPKFLGTVLAEPHPTLDNRIVIFRTDRQSRTDSAAFRKIFRKLKIGRIQNVYGEDLVDDLGYTRDQVVDYINAEANKTDVVTSGQSFTVGSSLDFIRDETNTSILFSNGDHHGVNSVRAEVKENGLIGIFPARGDVELYEVDASIITINSTAPAGTAQSVADALNALFTVSATPAPLAIPTFQLEDGEALSTVSIDTAIDTDGMIRNLTDGTKYHGPRLYTTETINEPGEYFTFEALNTVAGGGPLLGLGLYDASDESNDLDEIQATDLSNSGNHGYWWSLWLYNYTGYSAPWTTYGSNSGLNYGPGWNGPVADQFRYSDAEKGFREPENAPAKFRVGITSEGFAGVWYYDQENPLLSHGYGARTNGWILIARSSAPLPQGEYGLLVKLPTDSVQIVPGSFERFATIDAEDNNLPAPELFYRYIESPDGVFHYPLFSTAAEANYVSTDGQSHSHVYPDDSTQTTWYMPGASHGDDTTTYAVDDDGRPTDFPGGYDENGDPVDAISWTEIVSLTDAMQVPPQFYGLPLSVNELESVIYQTQPVDTPYVTTISGLPAGLVDAGGGVIMGTAPEVGGEGVDNVTLPSQDFTVNVTRTNTFGSSTGQLTITVANLTVPNDPPAGFTLVSGSLNQDGSLASNSVVGIDDGLAVGKRYVVPQLWAETNVLSQIDGSLDKAYFGVPATDAVWGSVNFHEDFDAVVRWEWLSGSSHRSSVSVANSSNANHITVSSLASAYYAYAIEWDGTDLSVIRSTSLSDLRTKHVSEFDASEVYTEANYTNQSGTLPLAFATKTGGSMLITTDGMEIIDIPAEPVSNLTPWTKALDFSGSSERAVQVSTSSAVNPMMMNGLAGPTVALPNDGKTANVSNARPWATACVFKYDGNNSNQHIWNQGEGVGGDNIYLRMSANGYLYFGWGRDGQGVNECSLGGALDTSKWFGVYIGFTGSRLSAGDATPANLAKCFDIYLMRLNDAGTAWTTRIGTLTDAEGNRSIASNWTQSGYKMTQANTGQLSLGGRGANRSFHGKIASFVTTTLRWGDYDMPTKAEAELMITDPKKWEDDYRVGQDVRLGNGPSTSVYNPANILSGYGGTQMWLMGDGAFDSYSNMIRNEVYPQDQNYTKLNLISMQSNDIQNVTIPGLS